VTSSTGAEGFPYLIGDSNTECHVLSMLDEYYGGSYTIFTGYCWDYATPTKYSFITTVVDSGYIDT
jgi:hypothetical protein